MSVHTAPQPRCGLQARCRGFACRAVRAGQQSRFRVRWRVRAVPKMPEHWCSGFSQFGLPCLLNRVG